MEAPNKIYTDNRGNYTTLPVFSQTDANIEYIRKDALLEWARKRMEELEANADDWSKGYICATLETFDKLNSF